MDMIKESGRRASRAIAHAMKSNKLARAAPALAVGGLMLMALGTGNASAADAANDTTTYYGMATYEWLAWVVGGAAMILGIYLKNLYAVIFAGVVLVIGLLSSMGVI